LPSYRKGSSVIHKASAKRRFLIVRHRNYRRFFFDIISRWVSVNLPSLDPWFEVHDLPVRVKDWSRYSLHVPWLQDPVQRWSMKTSTRRRSTSQRNAIGLGSRSSTVSIGS
jgi:hypothetical protein